MVYLICFDRPFKHARHYIGYCNDGEEALESRIDRHRRGDGSRLLRAVTAAGIGWKVVRTWPDGDRNFERKLKNRKKASELCPVCREGLRKAKLEAKIEEQLKKAG